eukprot:366529-Chlamydomonas_euryale.AAC.11
MSKVLDNSVLGRDSRSTVFATWAADSSRGPEHTVRIIARSCAAHAVCLASLGATPSGQCVRANTGGSAGVAPAAARAPRTFGLEARPTERTLPAEAKAPQGSPLGRRWPLFASAQPATRAWRPTMQLHRQCSSTCREERRWHWTRPEAAPNISASGRTKRSTHSTRGKPSVAAAAAAAAAAAEAAAALAIVILVLYCGCRRLCHACGGQQCRHVATPSVWQRRSGSMHSA